MAILTAQYIIRMKTGIPADSVINSFHFTTPSPVVLQSELDDVVAALKEFYDTPVQSAFSLSSVGLLLAGDDVSTQLRRIKIRKRQAVKPEPTLEEHEYNTSTGSASGAFPHEVAVVLSYRGVVGAGAVQRRRRGRIYLGPLSNQVGFSENSAGDIRPTPSARSTIAAAAARMQNRTGPAIWSTYSEVDQTASPVLDGWVDNAYDTQRRRGTKATSRTLW